MRWGFGGGRGQAAWRRSRCVGRVGMVGPCMGAWGAVRAEWRHLSHRSALTHPLCFAPGPAATPPPLLLLCRGAR